MVSEPRLVKEEKHQPCSLLSLLLADQVSCRSYVDSAYRMRSLAVYSHFFMYFRALGSFRSDTLRFKAWYWPCG